MNSTNPYAPPKAEVSDVRAPSTDQAPALWNPNAAALWSLLFSPIFGSLVHMKNWQALGNEDKAAESRKWAWISVAWFLGLTVLGAVLPDSRALDAISRFGSIGLLVAWYYGNGKPQVALVLARYGKSYPRRGWGQPIGLALLAFLGYLVAAVAVGFVIGMLTGKG